MRAIHLLIGVRPASISLLAALVVGLVLPGALAAQTLSLTEATIADISAALDAGTLTSEALLQQYLARIAAYDEQGPELNAILLAEPPMPSRRRECWIESVARAAPAPDFTGSRWC